MKSEITLIFLLSANLCFAQKVGEYPEIRSEHPRIMFNSDTWPEIQARAEGPAKKYLDKLLKECDAMTDDPHCQNTGPLNIKYGVQADGTVLSKTGTAVKNMTDFGQEAAMCALAWRFTKEKKYLFKAKKMLVESVRGYAEATENRRPVNWWSTGRINALCAYDWIYEALTAEERASIIMPLVEHVRLIQPETGLGIPRQTKGSITSGFYGTASLLWYSGLAAYGDGFCDNLAKEQLETGYDMYIKLLEYRNTTAGDDGGLSTIAICYSCEMYPYAHFNFFNSYLSSTGINIAKNYPEMALFPYWVYWSWIRDSNQLGNHIRHCGTADTVHRDNIIVVNRDFSNLFENMCAYVHFFKDVNKDAANFTATFANMFTANEMSFKFPAYPFLVESKFDSDPELEKKMKEPQIKARHFETMGQVHMRSGWNKNATYCTFTAGASVTAHKHYDENNFVIYKYDHLVLDSGCRGSQKDFNLTHYYAQSVAHNLVLIHKPEESLPSYWGPKSKDLADNFNYGGQVNHDPAKVLAFETNDTYTYIASDATASYGKKAKECIRQFVYVYPDYFIVYDRVASAKPTYEKDWLLHFQNEPYIENNIVRADAGKGRFYCQTFLPKDFKYDLIGGPGKEFQIGERNYPIRPADYNKYLEYAKENGRGPYTGEWRIELKSTKTESEVRFLNVITVGDTEMESPGPAVCVEDSVHDGVRINVNGQSLTVLFNRKGEVGGQIENHDGKVMPLSTTVQPQQGTIL